MFAAYTKMWKNTFNYRGLTSRKDYWLATLCGIFIIFIFVAVGRAFTPTLAVNEILFLALRLLPPAFTLATLLSTIAMQTRRLHDAGFSAWWQIIPLAGSILACLPAKKANNPYRQES